MNQQSDQQIISSVLAGSLHAYALLVDRYKNMVFTLAHNIVLNREDAEEVAQDAFVKAFNGLARFKAEAAFSTWLYRIVVNTALNKKKLQGQLTETLTSEFIIEDLESVPALLQPFVAAERRRFLQLALPELKEGERVCLSLYYLAELSVQEIHAVTGITAANIKVLLHRGRKHLYDQLQRILKNEAKNLI